MPIGNLSNKVSSKDVEKIREKKNPPEYEPGFEPDESSNSIFDDIFDDLNSSSSDSSGEKVSALSIFGGPPSGGNQDTVGQSGMGQTPGLGQPTIGGPQGGFGQPGGISPFGGLGQPNQMQQPVQPKPDVFDKIFSSAGSSIMAIGSILANLFKSIRNRTADDWGLYSRNMILSAVGMGVASVLLLIIGLASGVSALSIGGLPLQLLVCAILLFGTGLIGICASVIVIEVRGRNSEHTVDNISDKEPITNETDKNYDEDLQELLGDLFGEGEESSTEPEYEEPEDINVGEPVDFKAQLDSIPTNVPMLTREVLFNTFKPLLPLNTPKFAERIQIDPDSPDFENLETLCLKALASAGRTKFEELDSYLESAVETYFCYELRVKRIQGLSRLDDIAREITAYFRDSSDDTSVSSIVDIEGDFYKITVNKGIDAIVTAGDIFTLDESVEFFKNTKYALPVIAGVTESGKPLLVDLKLYNTVLIAGKPRSGKSWYIFSLLIMLMMFNTPEDVAFLIIDPKESNLFKTISLMPHVCGLHNDANILNILRDVIEGEGTRRKKLLADNKCDDIWDLRKRKNIQLPILYIVIDEIMTVIANLGSNEKELFELMKIIISQLPSAGIRLIFVPHRAQGIVDKTIRTLLDYTAAIRADEEVVKETLDIKKWGKPLSNPGDTALKLQGMGKEVFVKGTAITTSDPDNTEFVLNVAKAFYKMGVEIPDMRSLGCGYNRDTDEIKKELQSTESSDRVQFNIDDLDDNETIDY